MRNLRLDICYDGTRYRGWQRLPNGGDSVQGKIESVLSRVLDEQVEISGSGRTDAGVHAMHQIANCHCTSDLDCGEILSQLRRYLPDDIGIHSVKNASPRFHARLNALNKTYRYRLWNSDAPCVFDRRYVSCCSDTLDVEAMKLAASLLVGTHDFSAFCGNKHFKKSTVRTIFSLDIYTVDHEIQFFVKGNGFLHNMVRIIVGTLLEVGKGNRKPESVGELFGNKRSEAGPLAEACGLCLMEVEY